MEKNKELTDVLHNIQSAYGNRIWSDGQSVHAVHIPELSEFMGYDITGYHYENDRYLLKFRDFAFVPVRTNQYKGFDSDAEQLIEGEKLANFCKLPSGIYVDRQVASDAGVQNVLPLHHSKLSVCCYNFVPPFLWDLMRPGKVNNSKFSTLTYKIRRLFGGRISRRNLSISAETWSHLIPENNV